jgi:uncharacterized protein with GYD domain
MPKYMIKGTYAPSGAQGLLKEGGTSRRDTIGKLIEKGGGTLELFYYAFGDDDVYAVCDLPDHASAAALALAVNSSNAVRISTAVLMTPEEIDEASRKSVEYRAPGT